MTHCKVMGILNVTPDSFSDGGKYVDVCAAIDHACEMAEAGAEIIDVGGESTRPGCVPLNWEEEWKRIEPVVLGLRGIKLKAGVSIDTYHPETARLAISAGVDMINCVSPESVRAMLSLMEGNKVELTAPACAVDFADRDFASFQNRIYLDPMVGFGTTREQDLELIRSVPELAKRGRVLVGVSRKRIIASLAGEGGDLVGGSVAVALWCALNGASCVRVHDVRETVQALRIGDKLNCPLLTT